MKKLEILFVVVSLLALGRAAHGQRQSVFVPPQATDPAISTNLNNHYVSINRGVPPKNRLFLFFPGTGGLPFNYQEINRTAADLGFHAINLTYPNDEAVNTLCGGLAADLDCYARVRLEIKDGADRSPLVNVNRANSIENRVVKLLIYLRAQYPQDDWGQFTLDDATLDWSKIVVAGHSQGGGHAAIIGRYHAVARVVMLAAMDYNARAGAPANWIAVPAGTPNASAPDKFRGFAHQRDEMVNFALLSTRIWPAFGMPAFGAVTDVDAGTPPYGNSHSLTSNLECDNFHGCIAADARLVRQNGVPVYRPVWEYLLSNLPAPLKLSALGFVRAGRNVGRPPVGAAAKYYRLVVRGGAFDQTAKVFVDGRETATEFVGPEELRAALPAGKIGPVGGTSVEVRSSGGAVSNRLFF